MSGECQCLTLPNKNDKDEICICYINNLCFFPKIYAQNMMDLVSYQDTILHLEHITRNADTIIINKSIIDIRSIPNANLLVNDSLVMLGAMDGAVFRIKDGSLVRRMNEHPFHQSQMTGEPACIPVRRCWIAVGSTAMHGAMLSWGACASTSSRRWTLRPVRRWTLSM